MTLPISTPPLFPLTSPGATIQEMSLGGYRLSIPNGPAHQYRCAQLDDYKNIHNRRFDWLAPLRFSVTARVSRANLPGTWGFGLWNDPFSASQGLGGMSRRLPALPNTAWFFYASPPNYLALRDDHPAVGFLAATFSSPTIPSLLFAPAVFALPLLALKPAARLIRRLARLMIRESAALLFVDSCTWHTYRIDWQTDQTQFFIDEEIVFQTRISPRGRLGLVLWIDNQYMSFSPDGTLRFGTLASDDAAWMDIKDISLQPFG